MRKTGLITVLLFVLILVLVGCESQSDSDNSKVAPEKVQVEEKKDSVAEEARLPQTEAPEEVIPETAPFLGKTVPWYSLTRPVMVMVENSPAARPQAGLEDASIVYEFLAEGGITRFMALFYEKFPDRVGPIRSTRPYFVQTALEYRALLLHVGASTEGYRQLASTKLMHIDEISTNGYFWRDSSRKAPHNVYSGMKKLKDLFQRKYAPITIPARFTYQEAAFFTQSNTAKAKELTIRYWGDYSVTYRYDESRGQYLRLIGDRAHLMESGKKLYTNNIFVQYVDTNVKDQVGRLEMEMSGNGKLLLFRDGRVITGTWSKVQGEKTEYLDQDGKAIQLKPGQTWIQVVPGNAKVDYH